MYSDATKRFERMLKALFDRIDDELEDTYGADYPLHPSRPPRGRASNKEADGLFNVGAAFSAGYGSEHGRGYVIEVRLVTLAPVHESRREEIEHHVAQRVDSLLAEFFPGRDLDVVRDGSTFKIVGDLGP